MKNKLINYLKNKQIFVLSPHFDDALLSMGMLLSELKKYHNTTILNCFTQMHSGPHTISAKQFLKISGRTNAQNLYKIRAAEDWKALASINAKFINLDFQDALFRKKTKTNLIGKFLAEFDHLYPTYRWHIASNVNPKDESLEHLKIQLQKLIPENSVVLAPFGIGGHVDHIITSLAGRDLFKNVFYYIDFPYHFRLNKNGEPPQDYVKFDFEIDLPAKSILIQNYKSQINGLFRDGKVPPHTEKFFIPEKIIC